jgi:hypothetical protein
MKFEERMDYYMWLHGCLRRKLLDSTFSVWYHRRFNTGENRVPGCEKLDDAQLEECVQHMEAMLKLGYLRQFTRVLMKR